MTKETTQNNEQVNIETDAVDMQRAATHNDGGEHVGAELVLKFINTDISDLYGADQKAAVAHLNTIEPGAGSSNPDTEDFAIDKASIFEDLDEKDISSILSGILPEAGDIISVLAQQSGLSGDITGFDQIGRNFQDFNALSSASSELFQNLDSLGVLGNGAGLLAGSLNLLDEPSGLLFRGLERADFENSNNPVVTGQLSFINNSDLTPDSKSQDVSELDNKDQTADQGGQNDQPIDPTEDQTDDTTPNMLPLDEAITQLGDISLSFSGTRVGLTSMGVAQGDDGAGQVLRFQNGSDEALTFQLRAHGTDYTETFTVAANHEIFIFAPHASATYIASVEGGRNYTKASNPNEFQYDLLVEVDTETQDQGDDQGGIVEEPVVLENAGDDFVQIRSRDAAADYSLDTGAGDDSVRMKGRYEDSFFDLGEGNDDFRGRHGDDIVIAGEGDDFVRSNSGDDFLYGDDGDDRLFSGRDEDVVFGGAGDDRIRSGRGDDLLAGGAGDDDIRGGRDTDIAIFSGSIDEYTITFRGRRITVEDTIEGRDGTDTLRSVEGLIFGGESIVSDLIENVQKQAQSLGTDPQSISTEDILLQVIAEDSGLQTAIDRFVDAGSTASVASAKSEPSYTPSSIEGYNDATLYSVQNVQDLIA